MDQKEIMQYLVRQVVKIIEAMYVQPQITREEAVLQVTTILFDTWNHSISESEEKMKNAVQETIDELSSKIKEVNDNISELQKKL